MRDPSWQLVYLPIQLKALPILRRCIRDAIQTALIFIIQLQRQGLQMAVTRDGRKEILAISLVDARHSELVKLGKVLKRWQNSPSACNTDVDDT